MITILKNIVVHLKVGSVSLSNKTLTFDLLDENGEVMSACSDAYNPKESQISCRYLGLGFMPNESAPVVCDITYDSNSISQVAFENVRIMETDADKKTLDEAYKGNNKPVDFSVPMLLTLIDQVRRDASDRVAYLIIGEDACRQYENEAYTENEIRNQFREVIFASRALKNAYLSGVADASGYMESMCLNAEEAEILRSRLINPTLKPS
ncbi:MAG: hypothetical protein CTY38_00785 [Methylotenera sp.]|uniref:hypothetical protein n=1 Tax=Methylotenera sp. TaxID=2051956 RepID=UPI000D4173B8|nr:hypothetical protein [Methylotenera sp.]PPC84614.1 MAG: hypothetical protein CTY38_00785 [Methylotenera sp.]